MTRKTLTIAGATAQADRAGDQTTVSFTDPVERHNALPIENGRPRVQRLVANLMPVHLESEPIRLDDWRIAVGGLVDRTLDLSIEGLRALGTIEHTADFHCVWGWSKPRARWTGVPAAALLDAAGAGPGVTDVRFEAAEGPYAACLPIEQARDGLIALELDGEPLTAEHGGPARWLQPHYLWGYKGVKWLGRVLLLDAPRPGDWETAVGDVGGRVPEGIVSRFADLRTIGGAR